MFCSYSSCHLLDRVSRTHQLVSALCLRESDKKVSQKAVLPRIYQKAIKIIFKTKSNDSRLYVFVQAIVRVIFRFYETNASRRLKKLIITFIDSTDFLKLFLK